VVGETQVGIGDKVLVYRKGKSSFDQIYQPGTIIAVRGPDSYVIRQESGHEGNFNIRDIKKLTGSKTDDFLIGKRVRVWWPKYRKYYAGTVGETDDLAKGSHIVYYDDGEEIYENLMKERFHLLKSESGRKKVDYKFLDENLEDIYGKEEADVDESFEPESTSATESMSDYSETFEDFGGGV
jgi:hypothetical protein